MNHDTQPLEPSQVPSIEESRKEWWNKEKARLEASIHGLSPIEVAKQKLSEEQADLKAQAAWEQLKVNFSPIMRALKEAAEPPEHVHGPFTFLMNQNHNALRGCNTCGQAWVGVMAGSEDTLQWHPVPEPPEDETEEE